MTVMNNHLSRGLWVATVALTLAGCAKPAENERLQKMGVPPADFERSVVRGKGLYSINCSVCHGTQAQGSNSGPPLNHQFYEPSHHADLAFYKAVKLGAKQHKWNFGDMPAQPAVSPEDAGHIVAYIRGIQGQSGTR